jgi:uncharacterized membrane protein
MKTIVRLVIIVVASALVVVLKDRWQIPLARMLVFYYIGAIVGFAFMLLDDDKRG